MLYLSPGLRSILLIGHSEQDRTSLELILADSGLTLRAVGSIRDALDLLSGQDTPVVLCERDLPDGDSVGGSMVPVVKNTSQLSDDDRAAIATYLKSLSPVDGPSRPPRKR